MDMHAAYQEVGSYRAAAEICGTTPKTVKRAVLAAQAPRDGDGPRWSSTTTTPSETSSSSGWSGPRGRSRPSGSCRWSEPPATGLGPQLPPAGGRGQGAVAGRTTTGAGGPGVWAPGDMLVFDWGEIGPLFVFCAVLAWSRVRFVYFADNLGAEATMTALAECFEYLGAVPKTALDRSHGLPEGRHAWPGWSSRHRPTCASPPTTASGPDFCEGADPESKGLVENLVGYVKSDLMIPEELSVADLAGANAKGLTWCDEVNAVMHSEICCHSRRAPRDQERELMGDAAVSCGPRIGKVVAAQGRPAQLCPLRLGPLLGAERPHRAPASSSWRQDGSGAGHLLGRDHRRPRPRRPW